MKLELNGRNLFEALIGYGKYGDSQLEEKWNDKHEFAEVLQHHINEVESLYDQLGDPNVNHDLNVDIGFIGDVWNFLQEVYDQLANYDQSFALSCFK